jgi:flagellar hook-basal body complex protein FliE
MAITPISPSSIPGISASSIPSINGIDGINDTQKTTSGTGSVTKTFGDVLNTLNQSQTQADTLTQQLSAGDNVDLGQLMVGLQENDVNFKVAMSIRDYFVDAYREVMRMNI